MSFRWEYLFLLVILVTSVITDLKCDKIYNKIIVVGFVGLFISYVCDFSPDRIVSSVMGIVFPFIVFFVFFFFHMLGAGDIKLFSVVGGFLGIKGIACCLVISIISGAFFALLKMVVYHSFRERFAHFSCYVKKYLCTREVEPYYDNTVSDKAKINMSVFILIGTVVFVLGEGLIF